INVDMSFREKSVIGSLVLTVGIFGSYFFKVIEAFTSNSSDAIASLPGALIGVVITVVIVEVVYHVVIAIFSGEEDSDERDRLVDARATRISYYVLAAGCVTTIGHMLISEMVSEWLPDSVSRTPIFVANMLVFSFILSEIVGFSMQLFYYRRGV
ncbi:MAG: hypothetical protein ACR2QR_13390, partial [Woeseiaceae bacterium]